MRDRPMGVQFAVFNGHVNDADRRARRLLSATHPKLLERLEEIERDGGGIMAIFDISPEAASLLYAGAVLAFVNEDSPRDIATFLRTEAAAKQDLEGGEMWILHHLADQVDSAPAPHLHRPG